MLEKISYFENRLVPWSFIYKRHVCLPLVQSSCTTPFLGAESAYMQNMQDISQLKYGSASNLSNTDMERLEECARLAKESVMHESEAKGTPYLLASSLFLFVVFSSFSNFLAWGI